MIRRDGMSGIWFPRRNRVRRPTNVEVSPLVIGSECIACGAVLAPVLLRLGSLLCHDCRDEPMDVAAAKHLRNPDRNRVSHP